MKDGLKFSHIGIPTQDRQPENYLAGGKVYFNDFNKEKFGVEWLKFEEGSPMPKVLQERAHVAFEVENLAEALKGERVLVEPFDAGGGMTCAFIEHDGIAVELIQVAK